MNIRMGSWDITFDLELEGCIRFFKEYLGGGRLMGRHSNTGEVSQI